MKLPAVLLCLAILLTCSLQAQGDDHFQVYQPTYDLSQHNGKQPLYSLVPLHQSSLREKEHEIPLLLIHGTISEHEAYASWRCLLEDLEKDAQLAGIYAPYIYRYSSTARHWSHVSENLRQGIRELLSEYPDKQPFDAVVSSLGGIAICDALSQEPQISAQLRQGVSLGTPFWGVPLLNSENIDKMQGLPVFNALLFKSTDKLFPAIPESMAWKLPLESLDLQKKTIPIYCAGLRDRFLNHAAFLQSPMIQANTQHKEILAWLKEHILRPDYKHSWNVLMHYKMGYELYNSLPKHYAFNYNDGLVPLYSALWLDPQRVLLSNKQTLKKKDWQRILASRKHKIHLYPGLDHSQLTFSCAPENKEVRKRVLADLRDINGR